MNYFIRFITAAALVFTCGCAHHDEHDEHIEGEHQEEHNHSEDEIVLEEEDAARFGVRVDTVSLATFAEVVPVSGVITNSATDVALVTAPTSGIVTLSHGIETGSAVGRGAVVAKINPAAVSGGSVDAAARAALDAARRELDRIKPLYDEGIVTASQYNEALLAYETAQAAYSAPAAAGTAKSPIGGHITNLLVNTGEFVAAGQPVAEVAAGQRLLLRADVPTRYAQQIAGLTSANYRVAGGGEWHRAVHRVTAPTGIPQQTAGYTPVYFLIEGAGVPSGSFAEVNLLGATRQGVITVPVTAISEQQGERFVYIHLGGHAYRKQRVTLGSSDGLNVEVTSGLKDGDVVVSRGAAIVKLAENSANIPEGHSHTH